MTLPLQHEDIIRQQAREKGVDAALIAAVIDTESKFSDAESSAGARGLMQITPEAAKFIENTRDVFPGMVYTNVSFVGSSSLAEELMLLGPR